MVYNASLVHLISEQELTVPSFSGVESFVSTAELKSFRGAARKLGVTPAAVSKAVAKLEDRLGAKLLNRTTRHVSLTPEGELYLRHCREALDRLEAGEELVKEAAQVAAGVVRVSASPVLGPPIVRQLHRLTDRHPGLQVQLSVSDRTVGLVVEHVDVAVRLGALEDSALIARRLRSPRWVTVVAPTWLARHGPVDTVDDLAGHPAVKFVMPDGSLSELRFGPDSRVVNTATPVLVDDGNLLVEGALAGLGPAQVFDFMVDEHVRAGRLVELLPESAAEGPAVHALTLPGRQRSPRIRVFVDYLLDVLGRPSW